MELEELLRHRIQNIEFKIKSVETLIDEVIGKWNEAIEAKCEKQLYELRYADTTFIRCMWLNVRGFIFAELKNLQEFWEQKMSQIECKIKKQGAMNCLMSIQTIYLMNEQRYQRKQEEIHANQKNKWICKLPDREVHRKFSSHFQWHSDRNGENGAKRIFHTFCEICLINK